MRRPLSDKDGEVRELTAEDMRLFKPIAEVDPGMVEAMKDFRRKVGRPKAVAPKVHVGFRLSADIVASIKASGRGYNARVDQALREAGGAKALKIAKAAVKTTQGRRQSEAKRAVNGPRRRGWAETR